MDPKIALKCMENVCMISGPQNRLQNSFQNSVYFGAFCKSYQIHHFIITMRKNDKQVEVYLGSNFQTPVSYHWSHDNLCIHQIMN